MQPGHPVTDGGDKGLTSQVTPARQQTTYPVGHFITDSEEHQHIVAFRDPHGIEVTEDVGTCYPALEERGGVTEDNWGTFRVCLQSASQDNSGTFQGHGPRFLCPLLHHTTTRPFLHCFSDIPVTTSSFLCRTQNFCVLSHSEYREKPAMYLDGGTGVGSRC